MASTAVVLERLRVGIKTIASVGYGLGQGLQVRRCGAIGVIQVDRRPLGRQVDADLGHPGHGAQRFAHVVDTCRARHPGDGENESVLR